MSAPRRRKGHSVDGSVPGVNYNRQTHGLERSPPEPYSKEHLAGQGSGRMPRYDPFHPEYDDSGPDYRAPTPWPETVLPTTPELRLDPLPLEPIERPPTYKQTKEMGNLFWEVMEARGETPWSLATDPDGQSPQGALPGLRDLADTSAGMAITPPFVQQEDDQSSGSTRLERFYADDDDSQFHDTPPDFQLPPDAAAPVEDPQDLYSMMHNRYDQQMNEGLESLIQQAMPEPEPDPYDEEMRKMQQQFMDSFGPMGPMM